MNSSKSKTQIIKEISNKIDTQSIKSITEVVNTLIEVITEILADNQAVNIQGFLSIENKLLKGRSGKFNNVEFSTKSRLVPKPKLSKSFIDKVAQNES